MVEVDVCREVVRAAFARLRERYDLSAANVLVTGRILPATASQLRDLVAMAAAVKHVYVMEYSMPSAMGIGLDVTRPECQAILTLDDDWLELAEIASAGLRRKRSIG